MPDFWAGLLLGLLAGALMGAAVAWELVRLHAKVIPALPEIPEVPVATSPVHLRGDREGRFR